MDQLHEGFNRKWFLEKRDVIGGEAIGRAICFRQARHQDHPERLLRGQGSLDDFVAMDSRIGIFDGGKLKAWRWEHQIGHE